MVVVLTYVFSWSDLNKLDNVLVRVLLFKQSLKVP